MCRRQELFETPYFCSEQKQEYFDLARPFEGNPVLQRFAKLAAELGVVLPISYFERENNAHYNSMAVFDADGSCVGRYRKSHIPDGPGCAWTPLAREVFFCDFQSLAPRTLMARSARYQEKFYFNPGDTGFKIFHTKFATIGVAICWDQWFPEGARAMALQGAEARLTQPPQ